VPLGAWGFKSPLGHSVSYMIVSSVTAGGRASARTVLVPDILTAYLDEHDPDLLIDLPVPEDLDVTVVDGGPDEPGDLAEMFAEIADWVRQESGGETRPHP
jgi:hypothetical protein